MPFVGLALGRPCRRRRRRPPPIFVGTVVRLEGRRTGTGRATAGRGSSRTADSHRVQGPDPICRRTCGGWLPRRAVLRSCTAPPPALTMIESGALSLRQREPLTVGQRNRRSHGASSSDPLRHPPSRRGWPPTVQSAVIGARWYLIRICLLRSNPPHARITPRRARISFAQRFPALAQTLRGFRVCWPLT